MLKGIWNLEFGWRGGEEVRISHIKFLHLIVKLQGRILAYLTHSTELSIDHVMLAVYSSPGLAICIIWVFKSLLLK